MKSIELYHLDRDCRAITSNTFPVRWSASGSVGAADILANRTITGPDADHLAALFDRAFLLVPDTDLCGHFPNYGVRYFEGGELVLETTICLSCSNWIGVTRSSAERFRIAHSAFPDLSSALKHFLPLSAHEFA